MAKKTASAAYILWMLAGMAVAAVALAWIGGAYLQANSYGASDPDLSDTTDYVRCIVEVGDHNYCWAVYGEITSDDLFPDDDLFDTPIEITGIDAEEVY